MRSLLLLLAACNAPGTFAYDQDDLDATIRKWTGGLPVSGDLHFIGIISRDGDDWRTARGSAFLSCQPCQLGDDKTQLDMTDWFGDHGIDFGHITFDRVFATIDFGDGKYRLEVEWTGPELELDAVVGGKLAHHPDDFETRGCVQFDPTEALMKRDPKMYALTTITGAPLDEDGRYDIAIDGWFVNIQRLAKTCRIDP